MDFKLPQHLINLSRQIQEMFVFSLTFVVFFIIEEGNFFQNEVGQWRIFFARLMEGENCNMTQGTEAMKSPPLPLLRG